MELNNNLLSELTQAQKDRNYMFSFCIRSLTLNF